MISLGAILAASAILGGLYVLLGLLAASEATWKG